MKKIINLFITLIIGIVFLTGCNLASIVISNGDEITLYVGEEVTLNVTNTTELNDSYVFKSSNDCVNVDEKGVVKALKVGKSIVTVSMGTYSDNIIINVLEKEEKIVIELRSRQTSLYVGDEIELDLYVSPSSYLPEVKYTFTEGEDLVTINNKTLTAKKSGIVNFYAYIKDVKSMPLILEINEEEITSDPYENMSKEEFYANYTEAKSYMDAYYRTLHGFMSGSIEPQEQKPLVEIDQPTENGLLVKNTGMFYSDDQNTYFIVNSKGEVVDKVFKGGAYVTLEEVAAYVFAFGEIPANYSSSKKTKPSTSIWGEYLRVNHTAFSGSTSKYPYEPELPNINGCGGDLQYYEMDLGTTGTDCDPSYDIREYNNGYSIERGAARIVYSRYDKNNNKIIDINEKYLFYTYNHYNDFQEYLNYYGGWGEMFGNITGGGTLSSKYDYNPTEYVNVTLRNLLSSKYNINSIINDYRVSYL